MANSRFSYVRDYELSDRVIPNAWMIVRIDGKGFHRFSTAHEFAKPNDKRALDLMDAAAMHVMSQVADVITAFGESDEYSFLVRKNSKLYGRRQSKLLTLIVSTFTSAYVYKWPAFFATHPLEYPPVFDGRLVVYPGIEEVKDYFKWRGVDTHINNLYNTTFWALVQQGKLSAKEAHQELSGTFAKDKHEILFKRFEINYNQLPEQFRRGSTVVRIPPNTSNPSPEPDSFEKRDVVAGPVVIQSTDEPSETTPKYCKSKKPAKAVTTDGTTGEIVIVYVDIVRDDFWEQRPWLLSQE